MFKKIFVALALIAFIATQFNICAAMLTPNQIYLGGLTYGSKIDEMKKLHGEPDAIFFGVEGYETCEYANGAKITYDKISGQIKSIVATEKNSDWAGHDGLSVGMNIDEWLANNPAPELIKVGENKTVYLYFHYKADPVIHETFRDYGLFIAFNNQSGKITQLRIYGDTDFASFEESFDSVMTEMIK